MTKREGVITNLDIKVQLSDLRIFTSIVAVGSLSGAARQIGIAPMQVSRRIATLEEELGVRLFHRTTRSVSLTAEGEAFLPYARTMTEAEESARAEIGPSTSIVSGVLRLTAPSVFGQTIVLPLLQRLMGRHPELRVELDLSDRVVDIVSQGLDLALRVAPLGDSELVARRLAPNPRIICASPGYLSAHEIPRTVADLDSHECILLQAVPRWPLRVDGELVRKRVEGRVTTSSVDAVRIAAIQGLGLAMLAYWDVYQHLADGTLVEVQLQDAAMEELSVWAVMPTRRFLPTRVKVFLGELEDDLVDKHRAASVQLSLDRHLDPLRDSR